MKRFFNGRRIGCFLLSMALLGGTTWTVYGGKKIKEPEIATSTAVLMDADTGEVLYDKNMNKKRYPASTTKVMTALVAIENSSLTDQVTMGENAMKYVTPDNSHIDARLGETFTMEQCLYAILLSSANEVAAQVAEYIAGSEENFAKMMNERAKEIGCKKTNFVNASGLHHKRHYTNAYDMALILAEALKNPVFRQIEANTAYTIPPTNMYADPRNLTNHDAMFYQGEYFCEGIIAGKTGYTKAAHNTLVTAVERDGVTLVSAVLRADNLDYIHDTQTLMEYGFKNYKSIKAANAKAEKKEKEKKAEEAAAEKPEPAKEPQITATPTPTPLPKDEEVPAGINRMIPVLLGLNAAAVLLLFIVLIKKKKGSGNGN